MGIESTWRMSDQNMSFLEFGLMLARARYHSQYMHIFDSFPFRFAYLENIFPVSSVTTRGSERRFSVARHLRTFDPRLPKTHNHCSRMFSVLQSSCDFYHSHFLFDDRCRQSSIDTGISSSAHEDAHGVFRTISTRNVSKQEPCYRIGFCEICIDLSKEKYPSN